MQVSEQAIRDGIVPPCCELIATLSVHASDADNPQANETLAAAIRFGYEQPAMLTLFRLLLRLSKAANFAGVFLALEGHQMLAQLLSR